MYVPELEDDARLHAEYHDEWEHGAHFPPDTGDRILGKVCGFDLVEAATSDPAPYRRRFMHIAIQAARDTRYSLQYDGGEEEVRWDGRAYALRNKHRAVALVVVRLRDDGACWRSWQDEDSGVLFSGDIDESPRRVIDFAWILPSLRRQGVGTAMIRIVAEHLGAELGDLGWTTPLSAGGTRLVRRLTGVGYWAA
jgi:ribosomal protein S18 acetylase RimI-like enzyme